MEKLRAQTVLLTGQGMRIRGFSSSLSPLCLVLQLLALPQEPQHRCCIAQAQAAGVHPNFALLRGRPTTPQHPRPPRFPFLRIKGDVSPRTTTTLKKNKHNPPKKQRWNFYFPCAFCYISGGIWEVAAGSAAFDFVFSLFKGRCGDRDLPAPLTLPLPGNTH